MKTILYRYLIREQLIPVSLCFLGLTLVLITGRLMQVTRYLFTSNITVPDFVELIALAVPKLTLYTLPMATLVGVLLAFLRLKEDNELVAIRAAGIGFHQFRPAVLLIVLTTTLLSFLTAVYLMPASNNAFRNRLARLGQASIPALLQEGTFIDMVPDLVFFFEKVHSQDLSIEGIFIQDHRNPKVNAVIVAERAQLLFGENDSHLLFKIRDGVITRVDEDLANAQTVSFRVYDFTLPLHEIFSNPSGGPKHKGEMTLQELRRAIERGGPRNPNRYALEFHLRLALPVSCLLLGFVAAPLGALFQQGHRIAGVTLGLMIFLAYYVVFSAGKGMGENGAIPPALGIWMPNGLTLILALYLWAKMRKESSFRLLRCFAAAFALLKRRRRRIDS
jgi:lipopolysaccharide export system permease protein